MKPPRYILRDGIKLDAEAVDLIRWRTLPFLEKGMHMPLDHVLGEAYLQGVRDTLATQEPRP